jgi:hypothetical protein
MEKFLLLIEVSGDEEDVHELKQMIELGYPHELNEFPHRVLSLTPVTPREKQCPSTSRAPE